MSRLKHKRGRKSNYLKGLDNENHKAAKHQALLRDRFKCRRCQSSTNLEYHHISYHVLGKELEKDNLRWTVIVCEDCHQKIHDNTNDYWNPKNTHRQIA